MKKKFSQLSGGMKRKLFILTDAPGLAWPLEKYDWNEDLKFDLLDVVDFTKFLIRKD